MVTFRGTVLSFIGFFMATSSHSSTFSLGAGGGAGYMPMSEWEEFATSGPNAHYSADDLELHLDVLSRIRLAENHGLRVSYGRIFRSADWSIVSEFVPGPGSFTSVVEYTFRTAPLGVAYEFFVNGFESGSTTFAGLGAAAYFTSVEGKVRELGTSALADPPQSSERVGQGLGFEFFIGQRARVSERFSIDVKFGGDGLMGYCFQTMPVTSRLSSLVLMFRYSVSGSSAEPSDSPQLPTAVHGGRIDNSTVRESMTMDKPSRAELVKALQAAGAAHHDFEVNALRGIHDEQWSGWYAAYVLGRLGDFVTPTILAGWLSAAPASDDWPSSTADYIEERLAATGR